MSNQTESKTATTVRFSAAPWKYVGVWMTVILIVYILFNGVRAIGSPLDFAGYYGLPLGEGNNSAFVFVYAIRAFFLGIFGLALLLTRNFRGLALYTGVAVVMPIGDIILIASYGAGFGLIFRQILTGGFLLLTWFFLQRLVRSERSKEMS